MFSYCFIILENLFLLLVNVCVETELLISAFNTNHGCTSVTTEVDRTYTPGGFVICTDSSSSCSTSCSATTLERVVTWNLSCLHGEGNDQTEGAQDGLHPVHLTDQIIGGLKPEPEGRSVTASRRGALGKTLNCFHMAPEPVQSEPLNWPTRDQSDPDWTSAPGLIWWGLVEKGKNLTNKEFKSNSTILTPFSNAAWTCIRTLRQSISESGLVLMTMRMFRDEEQKQTNADTRWGEVRASQGSSVVGSVSRAWGGTTCNMQTQTDVVSHTNTSINVSWSWNSCSNSKHCCLSTTTRTNINTSQ